MRKIIATLVAAVYGLMLAITPTLALDVPATVTVNVVCELTVDQTPLSFGLLDEGQTSTVETRNVALNVNTPATVDISGDTWEGIDPSHTMPVSQTHYDKDNSVQSLALTLSSSLVNFFSASLDESHDASFDVRIPSLQAADTYAQLVTFTLGCDGGG